MTEIFSKVHFMVCFSFIFYFFFFVSPNNCYPVFTTISTHTNTLLWACIFKINKTTILIFAKKTILLQHIHMCSHFFSGACNQQSIEVPRICLHWHIFGYVCSHYSQEFKGVTSFNLVFG